MLKTILGSKIRMEQAFVEDTRVPVTLIKAGPCVVTQIKEEETDGYWAVQLGFGEKKARHLTKPLKGHLRGVIEKKKKAPRFLCEVKLKEKPECKVGDIISVSQIFKKGDLVSVTGTSKGKGFAGVVKRWGFAGGPRTHGQSDRQRAPGSIGQGTTPGRVFKGKKMAGRMGQDRVCIKNLIVVSVDDDVLTVSGPVPGNKDGLLIIKKLASGKLEELIQETPQAQVRQAEEEEVKEEGKESSEKEKEEKKDA